MLPGDPEDHPRGDPAETGFDQLRPLYEQVKERLRAGIDAGAFAPHAFLPTEPELCERFGVSRITLRRAVSDLCDEGLLRRQQGRGTVVESRRMRQELVVLAGFADLLQGSDEPIEHRVLDREDEAEEPEAARAFGRAERTRMPRFLRLILLGGRPLTLETLVLVPRRFDRLLDRLGGGASLFQSMRDAYGVEPVAADRLIDAGFPTPAERRHLRLGSSQAVFRVRKTTYGPEGVVAWSLLVTPAHLVTFSLRAETPGPGDADGGAPSTARGKGGPR